MLCLTTVHLSSLPSLVPSALALNPSSHHSCPLLTPPSPHYYSMQHGSMKMDDNNVQQGPLIESTQVWTCCILTRGVCSLEWEIITTIFILTYELFCKRNSFISKAWHFLFFSSKKLMWREMYDLCMFVCYVCFSLVKTCSKERKSKERKS